MIERPALHSARPCSVIAVLLSVMRVRIPKIHREAMRQLYGGLQNGSQTHCFLSVWACIGIISKGLEM